LGNFETITGKNNNKQSQGITGFLINGLYARKKIDKGAVVSALIPFIYKENRDLLSNTIKNILQ
jgi:non-canonical (house-cleaning) NTP pyrophosphatase